MASKFNTTTSFISKLMAPLPAHEEQVADKKFIRQLSKDMQAVWHKQMSLTRRAEHLRHSHENDCTEEAMRPYWWACDAQMRIPASNRGALNWKLGIRKFDNGHPDWEAQIERDQAWIAKLVEAGVR